MKLHMVLAAASACALFEGGSAFAAEAHREPFGTTSGGQAVEAVVLSNHHGMRARILAWGATLQSLEVPDRHGKVADVVLSYRDMAGFETGTMYFGATIGRYANRIAKGAFVLDGQTYTVPLNDGPNSLHGGRHGFDKQLWTIADVAGGKSAHVTFTRISPDGEEGYPGELKVSVTYSLDEAGALTISYTATTSKPTVINLTNHSYFNLSGANSGRDVLGERLTLLSDSFTPTDATLIPSGEVSPVAGTAFDFRTPHTIGERIHDGSNPQLVAAKGYDHNFVLRGGETAQPKLAARVEDPYSGRVLELLTTEPGLQVYSGNFLNGGLVGKDGYAYRQSDGLAMEPQHFPNSPNQSDFPSVRLDPGQVYRHVSVYRFSTTPR